MSCCWIRWSFWLTALLEVFCISIQDLEMRGVFYEEPALVCEDDLMEYSLQTMANSSARVRISVQDANGTLSPLTTNASCGIWAVPEMEGLLLLYVRYNACYTDTKAGFHTLTIFLESNTTGEWDVYQEEVLRCPVTAMDPPTPGECSNIPAGSRLPCDSQSVSQDHCLQNRCCYDPMDSRTPCYYGNKVTVQCTREGQFSIAISKDVTVPSLILPSVKLLRGKDPGCGPIVQNDIFIFFSFPLSACGTTQNEDGTSLVYENYFVADKDMKTERSSSISRDGTFRLHIRCSFFAGDTFPLSIEVFTLSPPPPATSAGSLTLKMKIAKDSFYGQYYTAEEYPILKFLNDPVYVEVHILNRNDPNVLLKLEQCWATNSEKPFHHSQWQILVDGCPFAGDNYMTQIVNVGDAAVQYPLHYKRFIVSTFTFVDSTSKMALGGLVYFHCSASVCVASSAEQCVTTCSTRRRRDLDNLKSGMLVSTEGPVAFYVHKNSLKEEKHDGGYISSMLWLLAVVPGSVLGVILLTVFLKKIIFY